MSRHNSGRRPAPRALKLVRGTLSRSAREADEPKPAPTAPTLPPALDAEERAVWDYICLQLESIGTLAVCDQFVIECLSVAVVEERALRAFLKANGRSYKSTSTTAGASRTVTRPRPEVVMLKTARNEIYRLASLLGLDPSSRSRLSVSAPPADDQARRDAAELLTPSHEMPRYDLLTPAR